jgi:hypothetical protein
MRQRIIVLALIVGTAVTGRGWIALQANQSKSLISGVSPFQTEPSNDVKVNLDVLSDGTLSVALGGHSTRVGTPFSRPLANRAMQAWILLSDGTSLAQRGKPGVAGAGNAGSATEWMFFRFERPATDNLAAVVARVDGNLAVVPIKSN